MTIKQLQKVLEVSDRQRVRVNDNRTCRKIDSIEGWIFEPEYDYQGTNVDEINRILSLKVDCAEFKNDWLIIWAH